MVEPVRVLVLAAALAGVGCSSSASSAPPVASCMNPSPEQVACNGCVASSCASAVSAVEASCSAYLACYEACKCSDGACLSGCAQATSGACATALGESGVCVQGTCKSACTVTGPPDAG